VRQGAQGARTLLGNSRAPCLYRRGLGRLLSQFVSDRTAAEHRHRGSPLNHGDMEAMGDRFLQSFPLERYHHLAEHIRYHLERADGGGFAFGLDLILDGLEGLRTRELGQG
jgi:hypothetical protein